MVPVSRPTPGAWDSFCEALPSDFPAPTRRRADLRLGTTHFRVPASGLDERTSAGGAAGPMRVSGSAATRRRGHHMHIHMLIKAGPGIPAHGQLVAGVPPRLRIRAPARLRDVRRGPSATPTRGTSDSRLAGLPSEFPSLPNRVDSGPTRCGAPPTVPPEMSRRPSGRATRAVGGLQNPHERRGDPLETTFTVHLGR